MGYKAVCEAFLPCRDYNEIKGLRKEGIMSEEKQKLYRSRDEKMIAGVCVGLAKYLGIDPTIIRLIFVLGLFCGGMTFWLYIAMIVIVPEEPSTPAEGEKK